MSHEPTLPEEGHKQVRSGAAIWRNPNFALLWGGQFVSAFGTKISGLALPILVLATTNSAAQAGFVTSARMVPYLFLGLPAGALVDRWNRKTTMIVADIARCVTLGSVPIAWLFGRVSLIQLYVVALVQGTAFVFFNVAEYAALAQVVDKKDLPRATALDSTAWSTASLLGPGVAGYVISLARTTAAGAVLGYLVDSITFLISVISLGFIRIGAASDPRRPGRDGGVSIAEDVRQGLAFVWQRAKLRGLACATAWLTLIYAPVSLAMIVLARGTFHNSPAEIGMVFSFSALGGIVGSLLAPGLCQRYELGKLFVVGIAVQAMATVGVALAPSALGLTAGWTIAFFVDPVLYTASSSYRLAVTPDALQARVQSIFRLGAYGGEPLGAALGGIAIAAFGPRGLVLGVATLAGACATFLVLGPLRTPLGSVA